MPAERREAVTKLVHPRDTEQPEPGGQISAEVVPSDHHDPTLVWPRGTDQAGQRGNTGRSFA